MSAYLSIKDRGSILMKAEFIFLTIIGQLGTMNVKKQNKALAQNIIQAVFCRVFNTKVDMLPQNQNSKAITPTGIAHCSIFSVPVVGNLVPLGNCIISKRFVCY